MTNLSYCSQIDLIVPLFDTIALNYDVNCYKNTHKNTIIHCKLVKIRKFLYFPGFPYACNLSRFRCKQVSFFSPQIFNRVNS